ncbi:MAG: KpsF/GutQ family sugar-phosphate isomerase [Syntrophus sp. (in: bacteria)]|nr:KpsF/GutQ family sugar-phosphate isomerase [Syntrophus sp. (in: bacteria)]
MQKDQAIVRAEDVLRVEAESILQLIGRLDENFSRAVDIIYRSTGRVIVTGIGKSGLIGKKIVATMTSTGTQALFLHPVEGLHGDLGIVTKDDVVLAISNSGETDEVNRLLSSIRKIGAPVISFTGNPSSTMARASNAVIDVGVEREACPFGLAPTSSSTASLAMGDALAVALIDKHKFSEKDFYQFHPGGSLGQRLRAKVREVMISGPDIPMVVTGTPSLEALAVLDERNKGFVLVTDRQNRLLGIMTDGDVRRMVRKGISLSDLPIDKIMTRSPKAIRDDWTIARTVEFMQRDEITALAVVNGDNILQGYIHLHDILGRGGTIRISIPA